MLILRRTLLPIWALTLLATAVVGTVVPTMAWADPPPPANEPAGKTSRWPEALKDRVSRYARLDRATDEEGDFRESVRARLDRRRTDDPRGDAQERWKLVLQHNKHGQSTHARLARQLDPASDLAEARLARLTIQRGKADFRRIGLIPAEERAEFAKYRAGLKEYGDLLRDGRILMGKQRGDEGALQRSESVRQRRSDEQGGRTQQERADDRDGYRDPLLTRERDSGLRDGSEREEAKLEQKAEKDQAKEAAKDERKAERDNAKLERKDEKATEKKEKATERGSDAAVERNQERTDERSLDKTFNSAESRSNTN